MTSEEDRHELYETLRRQLGYQSASTLMAELFAVNLNA